MHRYVPLLCHLGMPKKKREQQDAFKNRQLSTLTSATDAGEADAMGILPSSFEENTPNTHVGAAHYLLS